MNLPTGIEDCIAELSKLPGIGPKTAMRYTLLLAQKDRSDLNNFAQSISGLADLKTCSRCQMISDHEMCHICSSSRGTNATSMCVVETVADCLAIEKSGQFDGVYFVLGGVLNPLANISPEDLGLNKISQIVGENSIDHMILAINPSLEGDATCSYILGIMSQEIKIERIGLGIPMGGSLEYLDVMTISKALENKTIMS